MAPTAHHSHSLTGLPPLSRLLTAALGTMDRLNARHRSRQALDRLDDHLLRDIGLSDTARRAECAKAPWQD